MTSANLLDRPSLVELDALLAQLAERGYHISREFRPRRQGLKQEQRS